MKKTLLLSAVLTLAVLFPFINANSNAQVPPSKLTGAPGETTCAQGSGCHGSSAVDGTNQLVLDLGGMTSYDGSSTTLSVTIDDPMSSKFGFMITALDENDAMAGSFTVFTDNTFLQSSTVSGQPREYVSQFGSSSNNSWSFTWNSPSSNVGDVTFYIVGNAANNNGSPDAGDVIYSKSVTLVSGVTSDEEFSNSKTSVFPNPAIDKLQISNLSHYNSIAISDLNGQILLEKSIGSNELTLDTGLFKNGTYIISAVGPKNKWTEKIVINR